MASWGLPALWLTIKADILGEYPFSNPKITPHKLPLNHGTGSEYTVDSRLPTLASTPDKSDQELLQEPPEIHFLPLL